MELWLLIHQPGIWNTIILKELRTSKELTFSQNFEKGLKLSCYL